MNPYSILGVSATATDHEIRSAYRRLVKQYHPDKNNSAEAHERIVLINEAYDILSDSTRRRQYDNPFTFTAPVYEEDPREVYRREYIRKRNEREKLEKEKARRRREIKVKVLRVLSYPVLIFSIIVLIDRYLPETVFYESRQRSWATTDSTYSRTVYTVQTENFEFDVPSIVYNNCHLYSSDKPAFIVQATPIFNSIIAIDATQEESYTVFEDSSLYSFGFFFWILLFGSLHYATRKE